MSSAPEKQHASKLIDVKRKCAACDAKTILLIVSPAKHSGIYV